MSASCKLRIAWFSPLAKDGETSLSAYATETLLPYLTDRFEIELFHDSFFSHKSYPTYHYLNAFLRDKERPFDLFFYQLEDAPCTKFVRMHLGLMPGVTWFHHFFLSDDGPEPILNSGWQDTVELFSGKRTDWPERGKEYTRPGPQAYREAGLSFASLFSLERDHGEYERLVTHKLLAESDNRQSFFLPLPVSDEIFSCRNQQSTSARNPFRVGYFGSPRIEHRAHKVLQALTEGYEQEVQLHWVVPEQELAIAKERLSEFDLDAVLYPQATPEQWKQLLPEIDCALHPLFSVFGQPGAPLAMSLAAGVPTLVTGFGNTERLVDEVACKIEPGSREVTQIASALRQLMKRPRPLLNQEAQAFAREMYDARVIAAQLGDTFEHLVRGEESYLPQAMNRWRELEQDAAASLQSEVSSFLPSSLWEGEDGKLLQPVFEELGWSAKGGAS
ncbi:MAG: glycosyltransferase [Bdellovibrionales bacterium]|nr:glycosyltransferase [Bdellovibrionales bacterium]